jgi:hypothetical protein
MKISPNFSNVSAELYAIWKALEYSSGINDNKVAILTDSLASIQIIENSFRSFVKEQLLLNIVQGILNSQKEIVIQWVPGHVGIPGNMKADSLARSAANDGDLIPEEGIPLRHCDVICNIKNRLILKFNDIFREADKGGWYKKIKPMFSVTPWFENIYMSRQDTITMLRLRFGHCATNSRLFAIKRVESPLCQNCNGGSAEDITHIIFHCNKYSTQQHLLHNILRNKLDIQTENEFNNLLKEENSKFWCCILDFLRKIKKKV